VYRHLQISSKNIVNLSFISYSDLSTLCRYRGELTLHFILIFDTSRSSKNNGRRANRGNTVFCQRNFVKVIK